MIHRAKFQNFKALRDVEVTFDSRLTVLVGPNGSGKTSVLQGIDSICITLRNEAAAVLSPHGAHLFYTQNATEEMVLELGADLGNESFHNVRCRIRLPGPRSTNGASAFVVRTEVAEHPEVGSGSWIAAPSGIPRTDHVAATFLRLVPKELAGASVPDIVPVVAEDGKGLASVLVAMVLAEPTRFSALVAALREVVPTVRGIRFQRVPVWKTEREVVKIDSEELIRHVRREYTGDQMLYDFDHATGIPASMVSDGTLLATGLLAWMFAQNGRGTLLLDDIDHGLHPKAQMDLVAVLRKMLDRHSGLQVIATSHSPYILDKLKPNEVRVMALRADGSAACAKLEDHPKYPMWKDSMSPGEFWSHGGEDWVKQIPSQTAAP